MKINYFLALIYFFTSSALLAQDFEDVLIGISSGKSITFNGNDCYFSQWNGGKILKININETDPTPIQILGYSAERHYALIINGNDLYFTEQTNNRISKIDISETNPTSTVVVDGLSDPRGLAIKDNYLYIAEYDGDKISKIDINETNPTLINVVTNLDKPLKLKFKGNDLFFTQFGGKISKIDVTQTVPSVIDIITSINYPTALAINGNKLYVFDSNLWILYRIDITENNPQLEEILTIGQYDPYYIDDLEFHGDDLYAIGSARIFKINIDSLSLEESNVNNTVVKVYPNPSSEYIQLSGINNIEKFKIYDIIGSEIMSGIVHVNEKIDIRNFPNGLYFLNFKNGRTLKFVKK
jgi:hypothetical protein